MANIVQSIGYVHGYLHTGLIVYLCNLWNDDNRKPFESFCQGLCIDIRPHGKLLPCPEWNRIDLVIFDTHDNTALAAFEMKVDDHEHETTIFNNETGRNERGWQTVLYPKLLPSSTHFRFITLGIGEFFHPPYGDQRHWVRLADFHRALQMINSDNQVIADWKEAILSELNLRERVEHDIRPKENVYRKGVWNVTLLHHLLEKLLKMPVGSAIRESARIYLWGQAPDTILNFGIQGRVGPFYMEINGNGRLNLKTDLTKIESRAAPEEYVGRARTFWRSLFEKKLDHTRLHSPRRTASTTRTLLSFDIGLEYPENPDPENPDYGGLRCQTNADDTALRAGAILEVFIKGAKADPLA